MAWCDSCGETDEPVRPYAYNEPACKGGTGTLWLCDGCAGVDDDDNSSA